MVGIPRYLSGPHLAVGGVAFLVWTGAEAGFYGRTAVGVALALALGFAALAWPYFVLAPDGLRFALKLCGIVPITYARIERARILSITSRYDKENEYVECPEAGALYRVAYLGVFLEYAENRSGRPLRFTLRRAATPEMALRRGNEYAAALGCPLVRR
jgi:hypothetical protein